MGYTYYYNSLGKAREAISVEIWWHLCSDFAVADLIPISDISCMAATALEPYNFAQLLAPDLGNFASGYGRTGEGWRRSQLSCY